jgi:hypothetical protein
LSTSVYTHQRAKVVLLAAHGVPVKEIVARVGLEPTVIGWKRRVCSTRAVGENLDLELGIFEAQMRERLGRVD